MGFPHRHTLNACMMFRINWIETQLKRKRPQGSLSIKHAVIWSEWESTYWWPAR